MRKATLLFTFIFCAQLILAQNCPPSSNPYVHIVQKGETFYRIAKKHGLSVTDLTAMNGMTVNDILAICQKLNIKRKGELQSKGAEVVKNDFNKSLGQYVKQEGKYHYVQSGETIDNIAKLYGYTTERFRAFNKLTSFERIRIGQALLNSDCACTAETLPADKVTKEAEERFTEKGGNTKEKTEEEKPTTKPTTASGSGSLKLDPAKYPFMKGEELEMVEEINLVRSNPKGYIPHIKEYIKEMRNTKSFGFGDPVADSYELIEQLEETAPLSILVPSECVYTAAKKHGEDRKQAGSNDHVGTDGSWPWDRVLRECTHMRDGNENLVGGPANVRRAVILLLVDSGIPNRGHRTTLLNSNWRYVATYKIGTVGNMPNSWVQKFAY